MSQLISREYANQLTHSRTPDHPDRTPPAPAATCGYTPITPPDTPTPEPKENTVKTILKTAATVAAIAALGGGVLAVNTHASTSSRQLGRQVTVLERQLAADNQQIVDLTNQVGALNVPTDPLSAYNAVCNQPMTTNSGVTETYWFPCTNSAQTIPQPGN